MSFDRQPFLTSELVELRPLRPDDFDFLYEVGSDPLIWAQHPARTRYEETHWGGRYNGEMKRLMIEHAFQYLDSIVMFISPTNLRSQRAAEKIGAVRAGSSVDGDGLEQFDFRVWASGYQT